MPFPQQSSSLFRLCLVPTNKVLKRKNKKKWTEKKIKVNKIFWYTRSNSFHLLLVLIHFLFVVFKIKKNANNSHKKKWKNSFRLTLKKRMTFKENDILKKNSYFKI